MEAVGREVCELHASLCRSASATPRSASDALPSDADRRRRSGTHWRGGVPTSRPAASRRPAPRHGRRWRSTPTSDEAAELRGRRSAGSGAKSGAATGPGSVARVDLLLGPRGPGRPEDDARRAIAELALIAPDDPRVGELIRERAGG